MKMPVLELRLRAMLFLVICSLAALLFYDLYQSREQEFVRVEEEARNMGSLLATRVLSSVEKIDVVLADTAHDFAPVLATASNTDREKLNQDLLRREHTIPDIQALSLRVVAADGSVRFNSGQTGEVPKANVFDRAYFQTQLRHPEGGLVISEPILSRFSGKWVFTLSRAIIGPDGQFLGVVQTAMQANLIQQWFSQVHIGEHASLALFYAGRQLVARYPNLDEQLGKEFGLTEIQAGLSKQVDQACYQSISRVDQVKRLFCYHSVGQLPLVVNVGVSVNDLLQSWQQKAWIYGAALLAVALEIIFLILYQWRLNQTHLQLLEERVAERTHDLQQTQAILQETNARQAERIDTEIAKSRHQEHLLLLQARHAALGEMLGNIAHQWRQPLNAVGLLVQNMKYDHHDGLLTPEALESYVTQVVKLIGNMSSTIDDFRNFFKPNKEQVIFSPYQAVQHCLHLTSASLAAHHIATSIEGDHTLQVRGYEGEFTQAIMSLISNALDAHKLNTGQSAWLSATIQRCRDEVHVSIADNAGGIPAAIVEKIFDPYFTTKESGTGIGLYIANTVIREHMSGRITVENNNQGGTCFTICIPLYL